MDDSENRMDREPAPRGIYAETVSHPSGDPGRKLELAVFKEHRFSFYYWVKWNRQRSGSRDREAPPTLVTIDWHRDLAPPGDVEREKLNQLVISDNVEVIRFAADELDPHNDGHTLSAAWLNQVGDIILLKNYGMDQSESYRDRQGNEHRILEFRNGEAFRSALLSRNDSRIFLDIDLDYFIKTKVMPYQRKEVEIYSDEEIERMVDPQNELFLYLFERLEGITVATEPRYCGGLANSIHILEVVLDRLFHRDLHWRHLER